MIPSILLLDCANDLEEKLKKQGFDVESGNAGFIDGVRKLPSQIYEKDIIIYDPQPTIDENGLNTISGIIREETPQFPLNHIVAHLQRGAIVLAFIKSLDGRQHKTREAYSWIPGMPEIDPTHDNHVESLSNFQMLNPILSQQYVKLPVLQKIVAQPITEGFYFNRNQDRLGAFKNYGTGAIILLPDCKSNEQIIMNFLHRVAPKMLEYESGIQLIDKFFSPAEENLTKQLEKIEAEIEAKEEERDSTKQNVATANREKINTIKQDETAVLVLNYYSLALQQDDVALFYIYKVTEALEKKYGGEKQAKAALSKNTEWNIIGRLANSSYADVRHAPSPGEKVKEWTDLEIKDCFEGAEKIIRAYLKTLF